MYDQVQMIKTKEPKAANYMLLTEYHDQFDRKAEDGRLVLSKYLSAQMKESQNHSLDEIKITKFRYLHLFKAFYG